MKKTEAERLALAEKRILSVVTRHGAIIARTLEQKISDAGPFGQRIDPHVLTMARQALGRGKRIGSIEKGGYPWYFLTTDNRQLVNQRVDEQLAVLQRLHSHDLSLRTGQSLEIAFYRAIHATQNETGLSLLGSFTDLEKHDDKTLYSKEEPPSSIHGKTISGKKKNFCW